MTIFLFKSLAVVTLGASLLTQPASAQETARADRILAARDLLVHCTQSEAEEAGRLSVGYCLGAVTAAVDTAMTLNVAYQGEQTICLDADDTAESLRLSFLRFVEQNPESIDLPAATVLVAAFQTYFPCSSD